MDRSVWFTPTPQECRAQLRAAAELALKSIREPEPFRPRGPVLVSPRQFASWVRAGLITPDGRWIP